jgi:hypothetical protein
LGAARDDRLVQAFAADVDGRLRPSTDSLGPCSRSTRYATSTMALPTTMTVKPISSRRFARRRQSHHSAKISGQQGGRTSGTMAESDAGMV